VSQAGQMTHRPMQGHNEEGRPGEHHRGHDPVDAAQKRLGQLKQKLNLKPPQQAAWDTYSSNMIARVRAHVAEHEKMEGEGPRDHQNVSTPERMERMATMMRTGADNMSKAAADTKVFYDGLSVEQRTIFDLYAQNAWKGRMGRGEHHGHGMH
jgi:protein CpxP